MVDIKVIQTNCWYSDVTNCAPLVADLFLFIFLFFFNQAENIEAFNSTSRYMDDLLNIDYLYFKRMVNQIYSPELQLNKTNAHASGTETLFLGLHLSVSNGFVSTKMHDKCHYFNFDIVNFSILDCDVPSCSSYEVYISKLFRFARVCSRVTDVSGRKNV